MARPRSVKGVLEAARNLIKNVGWTQGTLYHTRDGSDHYSVRNSETPYREVEDKVDFCALGALLEVNTSYMDKAIIRLGQAAYRKYHPNVAKIKLDIVDAKAIITNYNDASHRKVDDVVALFDEAIENG